MNSRKRNIAVFGLGAIGSAVAYELQKNQSNILYYYSRTLKNNLKLIIDNKRQLIPIQMQTEVSKQVDLDWLVVCLKEYHYADAIDAISLLVDSQTKIAVIRNGLGLKEAFLDFSNESNILECSIDCPVQTSGDGFFEILKSPIITVQTGDLANEFAGLFLITELELKQVSDYKSECWKKVCESSALGAILCLSGETCWIFEKEDVRVLYLKILQEGIMVAKADGAKIENDFEEKMLRKLLDYPKSKSSSMLIDRLNGKPIELGAKNKLISEIGKAKSIQTPLNDLIVTLLSSTDRSLAKM